MIRFIILALLIAVPVGFYLYFFLKRVLNFWHVKTDKKWVKILVGVLAAFLGLNCVNLFSTVAMVLLHVVAVAVIMELLNLLLKKYNVWEKVYRCGLVPILIAAIVMGYGAWNIQQVRETDYTIYTEKNVPAEGYRVALITDLHFGTVMGEDKLQKYCDEISSKNPDVVLLGGDIVDERTSKEDMEAALAILGKMKSKYGVFYVYGNHDGNTYVATPAYSVQTLAETFTKNKIKILEDSTVKITSNLLLTGRKDVGFTRESGRASSEELGKTISDDTFNIVLDHQPVELKQNDANGFDLQLSGHTHAGQIWPVGLISDLLGFGEKNYGYEKENNMQVIVSSGIAGWGYAIRTGGHSEYVIVDIKKR